MAKSKDDIEKIMEDTNSQTSSGSEKIMEDTNSQTSSGSENVNAGGSALSNAATTYKVVLKRPIYTQAGAKPKKPGDNLDVVEETARLWLSLQLVDLAEGVTLPDPSNMQDDEDYPSLPISRPLETVSA